MTNLATLTEDCFSIAFLMNKINQRTEHNLLVVYPHLPLPIADTANPTLALLQGLPDKLCAWSLEHSEEIGFWWPLL